MSLPGDSMTVAVVAMGAVLAVRMLAQRASRVSPQEREMERQRQAMRNRNL